ncbi:hypothetical protein [Paenibacillus harenae]|uniref:capsular polysaccharide export protein, LipB/KpsS family n=1 Tax=Paenibacillus harenae TaxID=306543 RepID=UPI00040766B9|nr:hypothetical protein [Paenibacillus harenae]
MKYLQYRAFELTASFFYLFRNVRYKHVPVVRAMGYSFHRNAVRLYRRSKPGGRKWLFKKRTLYSRLVGNDHVTPVAYRPASRNPGKIVYSILVTKGLDVDRGNSITCIENRSRRRLKKPLYNPEASGRLHAGQYRSLLRQIRSIVRQRGIHPYFKRKSFMRWIRIQLRSVMRKIDGIDRLFGKNNVKGVIQFSSVNPMGYLLVHMGKQRRIPTMNIQFGLNDTYQILSTNIDHYVAWGEQHKKRLTQFGVPGSKFHLLGNARFDPIFTNKWMNKAELLKKLKIRPGKTVFVYPEQPLPQRHNRIVMRAILRSLLPYRKKVVLLVKNHPRQRGSGLTRSLVRKYPFARLIRHRSIQLNDLLNGSDAVFVQFSTTGLEAMLFRKPVISLAFFPDTNKHEYSYYASSRRVTSAKGYKQLKSIIKPFMRSGSYRRLMLAKQNMYVASAYNGGGDAKRKIKQFIQSVTGIKMGKVTAVIPVSANRYCPISLIEQTVKAARDSKTVDRIIIATDRSDLSNRFSRSSGVSMFQVNSSEQSFFSMDGDFAELCLRQLKQEFVRNGGESDMIALLAPAFPFRTSRHIGRAIQLLISSRADTVRSVSTPPNAPQESALAPNGAVVASKASVLLETGSLIGANVIPYEMQAADALEVNNEEEFVQADSLRAELSRNNRIIRKRKRVRLRKKRRKKRKASKKA